MRSPRRTHRVSFAVLCIQPRPCCSRPDPELQREAQALGTHVMDPPCIRYLRTVVRWACWQACSTGWQLVHPGRERTGGVATSLSCRNGELFGSRTKTAEQTAVRPWVCFLCEIKKKSEASHPGGDETPSMLFRNSELPERRPPRRGPPPPLSVE